MLLLELCESVGHHAQNSRVIFNVIARFGAHYFPNLLDLGVRRLKFTSQESNMLFKLGNPRE
ncbi:hypothetical protein, partial [Escherichia coli]|uniref:hypothetical protein n=1 Tax=Escherichia coli TaxID=562 RepID=UPI001F3B1DCD